MKLTGAVIVKSTGSDHILIDTTLPEPCYPFNGNLCIRFSVAADTGEHYMKKYFPDVPYTVVDR